jgi:hypothetical protein
VEVGKSGGAILGRRRISFARFVECCAVTERVEYLRVVEKLIPPFPRGLCAWSNREI